MTGVLRGNTQLAQENGGSSAARALLIWQSKGQEKAKSLIFFHFDFVSYSIQARAHD